MRLTRATKNFSPVILLSSLFLLPTAWAAIENNFDIYPSAAQPCLYSAADGSGCSGEDSTLMNDCLCGDKQGGWITLTAQCLGSENIGSSVVDDTYSQMTINCGDSNSPLGLTRTQFSEAVADAKISSTTTTTASSTTSKQIIQTTLTAEEKTVVVTVSGLVVTLTTVAPPVTETTGGSETSSSPTSSETTSGTGDGGDDSNSDSDPGLSKRAKIAIIASSASAGAMIIAAIIYFIVRRRRSSSDMRRRAESYPMLEGDHQQPTPIPHSLESSQLPTVLPSPEPPSAYNSGGGLVYKDEDKWRPQSGPWTSNNPQSPPGDGGYPPQTQWGAQQPGFQTGRGNHHPSTVVPGGQTRFVAELDTTVTHQVFELGDSGVRPPPQRPGW